MGPEAQVWSTKAQKVPRGESGAPEECGQRASPSICPPSRLWMATWWKRSHPRLSGLTGKQGRVPSPIRMCLMGGNWPDLWAQNTRAPTDQAPLCLGLSGWELGWGLCLCRSLQVTSGPREGGRGLEAEKSRAPRGHPGLSWASWISECSLSKGGVDRDGIPRSLALLTPVTGSSFLSHHYE